MPGPGEWHRMVAGLNRSFGILVEESAMKRCCLCITLLAGLVLATAVAAADPPAPSLASVQGVIAKVENETLTVSPRGPDGKFGKNVVLKLTGTSKFATLTFQMRAGKMVPVQKDTDAKGLTAKQAVAVLYTTVADGPVLLTAVVLPPSR